jgi:outer membrane beta-barrel protein
MRSPHCKPLLIGVLCSVVAAATGFGAPSAYAQKKKDPPKAAPKADPKAAPATAPVEEGEIEMEGDAAAGAAAGGEAGGVVEGEIEMEGESAPEPSLEADTAAASSSDDQAAVKASTALASQSRLSWQDIVVVIRKPFLKVGRVELMPMVGTTMNDNIIRHYAVGAQLNYYLTDVLSLGLEGQYYQDQFREPFDLIARQARRLPTVNKYNYSAALNFGYVPVYGKFAILDKHIVTWEAALSAGVGVTQSEVIPRDTKFPGFKNDFNITFSPGASMRFFIFKWLTVNFSVRDYIFIDKFEPTDRSAQMNDTADEAKDNADSSLINNVMFQIGLSFWLPTSFEYTTFR